MRTIALITLSILAFSSVASAEIFHCVGDSPFSEIDIEPFELVSGGSDDINKQIVLDNDKFEIYVQQLNGIGTEDSTISISIVSKGQSDQPPIGRATGGISAPVTYSTTTYNRVKCGQIGMDMKSEAQQLIDAIAFVDALKEEKEKKDAAAAKAGQ